MRIDRAVAAEVIARVQPFGVEAALGALETSRVEQVEKRRQIALAFAQARAATIRRRRS